MTYAVTQGYDVKGRFASYWHQQDEILRLQPKTLLECGIGNNFMYRYLQGQGIYHVTLDISRQFGPTVNASVRELPFCDEAFDVVACFQILEHLPYEYFDGILGELHRVSKKHVIISLPNRSLFLGFAAIAYPVREVWRGLSLELFMKDHVFDGEHHWEIGKKGFPANKIVAAMELRKFIVKRHYRVPEKPLHHFFVLEKN
jgi:hypothetical protein